MNKYAAKHVAIAAHSAAYVRQHSHYGLRVKQHLNDAMVQFHIISEEPFLLESAVFRIVYYVYTICIDKDN